MVGPSDLNTQTSFDPRFICPRSSDSPISDLQCTLVALSGAWRFTAGGQDWMLHSPAAFQKASLGGMQERSGAAKR